MVMSRRGLNPSFSFQSQEENKKAGSAERGQRLIEQIKKSAAEENERRRKKKQQEEEAGKKRTGVEPDKGFIRRMLDRLYGTQEK